MPFFTGGGGGGGGGGNKVPFFTRGRGATRCPSLKGGGGGGGGGGGNKVPSLLELKQ